MEKTELHGEPSSKNVTILRYLLQNEAIPGMAPIVNNELSDPDDTRAPGLAVPETVTIFECPHPGCKKHYFKQEHLQAHKRFHSGDLVCNWEMVQPENARVTANEDSELEFLLTNQQLELFFGSETGKRQTLDGDGATNNGSAVEETIDEHEEEHVEVLIDAGELEDMGKDEEFEEQRLMEETDYTTIQANRSPLEEEVFLMPSDAEADTTSEDTLPMDNQPKRPPYSSAKDRNHRCLWVGCEKTYTKLSHVKIHYRTHTGEMPHICSWSGCGQRFSRTETLNRHFRKHTNDRSFSCSEYSARFFRNDHLRSHLMTRHRASEVPEKASKREGNRKRSKQLKQPAKLQLVTLSPRVFCCLEAGCDKSYTRLSHLKAHQLLHTGELPFRCPWENCGSSFARSFELSRHRRQHTGEKKFICHICQQPFMRSDHLSRHVKRHTFRPNLPDEC